MSSIKQKDYLKKYLSIGKDRKEKKKRKKNIKSNIAPSRLTIIDDNADTFNTAVKEDLLEDEDAPQIVAIIDERPPSLQIDEKSKTNLWIPIGGVKEELSSNSINTRDVEDLSPPRSKFKLALKRNLEISPPRKQSSNTRNVHEEITVKTEYVSPPREENYSSHPRKLDRKKSSKQESADDITPPRKEVICKEEKIDDDFSPPRRRCELIETPNETHRQKSDDDFSPPRKRRELTPPEKSHRKKSSRWESTNNDESSLRHESNKKGDRRLGENCTDKDISPPRKRSRTTPEKMMKTLDGKTAGLQNAKQLAKETSLHKEKELEMFNKMSTSVSGANASTIIRDKKTGRVRNFEEEAARELEKKKKENVNKEKYSRWGRGLKQVEDATKRKEEELNEMSKPLARYANDDDLEKYLKEQERDGDPMLAYIRKKKKKKDVDEGKPIKPEYMGEFMPNRFGIKPGHRWDGVDRSNGYEKKWFDNQNSKLAELEESYKWSTEDM